MLQVVKLAGGGTLPYDKVCICSGATPKAVADHPAVLVLRDSDSVQALCRCVYKPAGSSAVNATSSGSTTCLYLALLAQPASICPLRLPSKTACLSPYTVMQLVFANQSGQGTSKMSPRQSHCLRLAEACPAACLRPCALCRRLPGVRRLVLVGNGGIALELAHSIRGVEVGLVLGVCSRVGAHHSCLGSSMCRGHRHQAVQLLQSRELLLCRLGFLNESHGCFGPGRHQATWFACITPTSQRTWPA